MFLFDSHPWLSDTISLKMQIGIPQDTIFPRINNTPNFDLKNFENKIKINTVRLSKKKKKKWYTLSF